jgi:hypothetical protein
MYDNPLTNVYNRLKTKRLSSRVMAMAKVRYKRTYLITTMYTNLGEKRSISRDRTVLDIEKQTIDDRFGDVPK